MNVRDLIPWGHHQPPGARGGEIMDPVLALHREMNRMFDDVLRGFDPRPMPAGMAGLGWPRTDVVETATEYKVTTELPGLEEKDVELTFQDGALTLKGEKKIERDGENERFSERYYGHFLRTVALGSDVDEDKINASFKNGVLTVVLPKSPEAEARTKRIPITH